MDIKVVFTRASIFIFVYALVLGIPFWLGFKLLGNGLWLYPITVMAILATAGPSIYLYIQKRAEDRLMIDQRRYQATLRQASSGMGKIKDLKKLLNMIVYVLTRSVRMDHSIVYIYKEEKGYFVQGAIKRRTGHAGYPDRIERNNELIHFLKDVQRPVLLDELVQKNQDKTDSRYIKCIDMYKVLNAELVFPIFVDTDLTALVVMGKKENNKPYIEDDISVFTILANQAALAIENAQFYEDMKKTQEQLFQAEKMATIGTMADGLSHQINNRFHALGFIAGDALDTINMNRNELLSDKAKEMIDDLEKAFKRVQDNVIQGGEVVQGLLRYTRKGDAGFSAVDIESVIKASLEMLQFKIKTNELKVVRKFDVNTVPKIKGNATQLQEVFFNLIDNGFDAMMQRKNELSEAGFVPTIEVFVNIIDHTKIQMIFKDNGIGVKEEDLHKIFTPFFTTKLSSKKGTGLGLYVIKKIIEENHGGTGEFASKYKQGTEMKLTLPIAQV
jgi:signal transduction histidine kinase